MIGSGIASFGLCYSLGCHAIYNQLKIEYVHCGIHSWKAQEWRRKTGVFVLGTGGQVTANIVQDITERLLKTGESGGNKFMWE